MLTVRNDASCRFRILLAKSVVDHESDNGVTYDDAGEVRVQDPLLLVVPSVDLQKLRTEVLHDCVVFVGSIAIRSDAANKHKCPKHGTMLRWTDYLLTRKPLASLD